MALLNLDPIFDFGMGFPRDPWGLYRMDPLTRWAESSVPSLLSIDLPTTTSKKRQPVREVVSDQEKYQVNSFNFVPIFNSI